MICCDKCFKDIELKAIIQGLDKKGDCETCRREDVYLYDTTENYQLVDYLNGLLEIYQSVENLPEDFPKEKTNMLKNEFYDEWNLFDIDKEDVYLLVKNICHEKYSESREIFDTPIGIMKENDAEYIAQNSLLKNHKWEEFVKEIKTQSRFHIDFINKEVLNAFCENAIKVYKKGTKFYRGRISSERGHRLKDMGPPPPENAVDGRANPLGISCLYLANDTKTTLHEIRAGAYDYITVGEFELLEDIEVIDFTILDKISPFSVDSMEQYAINKKHLRKISDEIAKPLRRNDGPLDYLPTQYITDFIKSKGHNGIEYKSTMNKKGYNLAVFHESFFECKKVSIYKIDRIDYEYDIVE